MAENFLSTSIFPNSDFSESIDYNYPSARMSIFPSLPVTNANNVPKKSERQETFNFSTMTRWQSEIDHLNFQSNLSTDNFFANDFCAKKNMPSSSVADLLISPMSRLSTSSSLRSFKSVGSYQTSEQLASHSTLTNSTDQLIASNENINLFPSSSSLLPLSTSVPNRATLSPIENFSTTIIDYDLQQVPPSFIIMHPSNNYGDTPLIHSQTLPPQAQLLHSTGRSNSMPSWRGHLPMRFDPITIESYQMTSHFSQKVFLGGIPPQLTEGELLLVLRKFGKCNIKWPKNDGFNHHNIPGFCHVVFREPRSVPELLKHCIRQQRSTTEYFLHIHLSPTSSSSTTTSTFPVRTSRLKPIQVVPWNMKENVYVMQQENVSSNADERLLPKDWSKTIFVSPLHGKMSAYSLSSIMSNIFGCVSMSQINTDKYGYPTGTGTVLFRDSHSYMRAVAAGVIDIKCDCFHKMIDIDPYLRENEVCWYCSLVGEMFCRNFHCLRSYCGKCWVNRHGPKPLADHQPVTRRQQTL